MTFRTFLRIFLYVVVPFGVIAFVVSQYVKAWREVWG